LTAAVRRGDRGRTDCFIHCGLGCPQCEIEVAVGAYIRFSVGVKPDVAESGKLEVNKCPDAPPFLVHVTDGSAITAHVTWTYRSPPGGG
jgi:hypothetical protein